MSAGATSVTEASRRRNHDAPRDPWWWGAGSYALGLLVVVVIGSAIILVFLEDLWVLAVIIVAVAALAYAVTSWLNGDWDS
jgi:hypothetical protein